jgi:plasmid maintenance system antidote protein VapI
MLVDMAEKGWLATHLAKTAGVSDMTVSRFLSGEVQTAPTAKKLAKALGRSIRRYLVLPEALSA